MKHAEPSASRGWLSSSGIVGLGDRAFARRLALAFALSIALHEILAGLMPGHDEPRTAQHVVTYVVTIAKRTPPPPTPQPRRTPRPPTPAPHYTLAPVVTVHAPAPRAVAPVRRHAGGAAAPKHIVRVTPPPFHSPPPINLPPKSIATGEAVGLAGGGNGTGAGPGAGQGGANGNGSGSGTNGSGSGGDANTAPCGFVDLIGRLDHVDSDGTQHEHVRIEVRLRDGTVLSDELHWLFVYKSEQDNPFSSLHRHDDYPAVLQTPPPGFDLSVQKPATIFALKHTGPDGYTDLPECPGQT